MSVLVLTPPRKALTCATVPVMVIDDVPVPVTVAPKSPAVAAMVPSPTDSVTDIEPEPASTSEIERPGALERERLPSVAAYVAGVITAPGASLTAVMLMVAVSCAVSAPPPVLPLSSTASVSVVRGRRRIRVLV